MPLISDTDTHTGPAVRRVASVVSESVVFPIRAIAFWTTILLPVCALVMLAVGVASVTLPTAIGFLAVYSACAIAGHNHTPQ
ncbi:hypothetical protein [Natronobacterium texcoconense]|uniref:Uncharacterized protein n=1 Tax=Natronobacterium texcoconense TaxID=1095778 RepID=A0A1H1BMX0_NATTX|nr:hypothetical protein [Natronobacterium texcoconense]SDQ53287.1 hypothetical protein SAMN04489842_1094 [Natronobacterium texcoconense]